MCIGLFGNTVCDTSIIKVDCVFAKMVVIYSTNMGKWIRISDKRVTTRIHREKFYCFYDVAYLCFEEQIYGYELSFLHSFQGERIDKQIGDRIKNLIGREAIMAQREREKREKENQIKILENEHDKERARRRAIYEKYPENWESFGMSSGSFSPR